MGSRRGSKGPGRPSPRTKVSPGMHQAAVSAPERHGPTLPRKAEPQQRQRSPGATPHCSLPSTGIKAGTAGALVFTSLPICKRCHHLPMPVQQWSQTGAAALLFSYSVHATTSCGPALWPDCPEPLPGQGALRGRAGLSHLDANGHRTLSPEQGKEGTLPEGSHTAHPRHQCARKRSWCLGLGCQTHMQSRREL